MDLESRSERKSDLFERRVTAASIWQNTLLPEVFMGYAALREEDGQVTCASRSAKTSRTCQPPRRRTSELWCAQMTSPRVVYQEGLEWLHHKMKKRFKASKLVVGARENVDTEAKVLKRIIRVNSSGWEYEVDQRHAGILIKTLNVEHANPVCTPERRKDG